MATSAQITNPNHFGVQVQQIQHDFAFWYAHNICVNTLIERFLTMSTPSEPCNLPVAKVADDGTKPVSSKKTVPPTKAKTVPPTNSKTMPSANTKTQPPTNTKTQPPINSSQTKSAGAATKKVPPSDKKSNSTCGKDKSQLNKDGSS